MKIIDLLNKIANGEEIPNKILYNEIVWEYETYKRDYRSRHNAELLFDDEIDNKWLVRHLNTEIKIIEEKKKIPEKLDVISWNKCIYDVTHKEKELAIEINKTQELLNQVIDYLKSKGE